MDELLSQTIICSRPDQFVATMNRANKSLPLEVRMQVVRVYLSYSRRFGIEGVFDRMNNRSFATILSEFDPGQDPTLTAEGEINGVKYMLFDPPSSPTG